MIEKFPGAQLSREEVLRNALQALVEEIYSLWPEGDVVELDPVAYARCKEEGRTLESMLTLLELAVPELPALAEDKRARGIFTGYAKYAEDLLRSMPLSPGN